MIFISLFAMGFAVVSKMFAPTPSGFSFYSQRNNDIDVLFIGSSHVQQGINPFVIWHETGIRSVNLASSALSPGVSWNYANEALKTQKPKIIIIDVYMFHHLPPPIYLKGYFYRENPAQLSGFLANLPPSINKINALRLNAPSELRTRFFFDIISNHTRWKSIGKNNIEYLLTGYDSTHNIRFNGYAFDIKTTLNIIPNDESYNTMEYPVTLEIQPMHGLHRETLERLLKLSQKEGFELVLWNAPSQNPLNNEFSQRILNDVREFAEQNGILFLDYNYLHLREEAGIDFTTDFRDNRENSHCNYIGAEKLSRHIAHFLQETYGLQDYRGVVGYEHWEIMASEYFLFEEQERLKTETE
jgi:hypothetical protein